MLVLPVVSLVSRLFHFLCFYLSSVTMRLGQCVSRIQWEKQHTRLNSAMKRQHILSRFREGKSLTLVSGRVDIQQQQQGQGQDQSKQPKTLLFTAAQRNRESRRAMLLSTLGRTYNILIIQEKYSTFTTRNQSDEQEMRSTTVQILRRHQSDGLYIPVAHTVWKLTNL
jgi:hypothetical protein